MSCSKESPHWVHLRNLGEQGPSLLFHRVRRTFWLISCEGAGLWSVLPRSPMIGRLVPPTTHYPPFARAPFLIPAVLVFPRLKPPEFPWGRQRCWHEGLSTGRKWRGVVTTRREKNVPPEALPLACLPLNIFSPHSAPSPSSSSSLCSDPHLLLWGTPLPAEGLNPSDQNLPANDTWLWLRQEVGACKSSK